MKLFRRWLPLWGRVDSDQDFVEFEGYLNSVFQPIHPRVAFVGNLKEQLMVAPIPEDNEAVNVMQYFFLAVAGVLSGLVLVAASVRAVVTILATLRLLRNIKTQGRQKPPASFPIT
jgi:hypothetical protein